MERVSRHRRIMVMMSVPLLLVCGCATGTSDLATFVADFARQIIAAWAL